MVMSDTRHIFVHRKTGKVLEKAGLQHLELFMKYPRKLAGVDPESAQKLRDKLPGMDIAEFGEMPLKLRQLVWKNWLQVSFWYMSGVNVMTDVLTNRDISRVQDLILDSGRKVKHVTVYENDKLKYDSPFKEFLMATYPKQLSASVAARVYRAAVAAVIRILRG